MDTVNHIHRLIA